MSLITQKLINLRGLLKKRLEGQIPTDKETSFNHQPYGYLTQAYFKCCEGLLWYDATQCDDIEFTERQRINIKMMGKELIEDEEKSLDCLLSAHEIFGYADGMAYRNFFVTISASQKAMKRNAENRSIKAACIAYYASTHEARINSLDKRLQAKAKDAAAIEMTKQQPISTRKAREYISEYLKEKKVNTTC
jgi:hypothetical protein